MLTKHEDKGRKTGRFRDRFPRNLIRVSFSSRQREQLAKRHGSSIVYGAHVERQPLDLDQNSILTQPQAGPLFTMVGLINSSNYHMRARSLPKF